MCHEQYEVFRRPVRLPPRPAFLTGREDLVAGLADRLAGSGPGPQVVALCGLGGAGKTSVAVEYAHRHLSGLDLVWLLVAEDSQMLVAAFGDLAALLGGQNQLGGGDPVASVHAILAARQAPWLLIFDNAPAVAEVAEFLPPAGNGQVIITSQNPHWLGDQPVDVPVLDQAAAAEFLMTRTSDIDEPAARQLAEELAGLPLALEQAAAYAVAAGRSLADYLRLYQQRRAELLDRGETGGYGKRVTTTWSLAFARLDEQSPAGTGLLRLLACCAADAIPYRLLLQALPAGQLPPETRPVLAALAGDQVAADDAIMALRRYSLISPPAHGLVSLHRLVQAITLGQLGPPRAQAWREAAAALVAAALPGSPRDPGTWSAYAALLAHACALLPPHSNSMHEIASYLGHSGNYAAARNLLHQILGPSQQELGSEHPATLAIRHDLASLTGHAGNATSARDQYADLLPALEQVHGPRHPRTLEARDNLAFWIGCAGDPAAARDQLADLLPAMEQAFGPGHPRAIETRYSLALWTGFAGNAASARDQLASLLPATEQVLGPDHPRTLTTRKDLAHWASRAEPLSSSQPTSRPAARHKHAKPA